jgi:hypothetical protein
MARKATLVLDRIEASAEGRNCRRLFEIRLDEVQRVGERLPVRLVRRSPGEAFDALPGERPVPVVAQVLPSDANDREPGREESVDVQVVQRGQQLPMSQSRWL